MNEKNVMIVKDSDPDSPIALSALKPVIDELKQFASGYPDLKVKESPRFVPGAGINDHRELIITEPLLGDTAPIRGTLRLRCVKDRREKK